MTCPSCQRQISSDSKFCNYCGTSVTKVEMPLTSGR
ncbi:MAG: zinc-ribbon domain-containing protein [Candidatus Brockarchaeota archaeon]|nr:zinc-ribbon domain-containing protein [Candidatus Brockarchaeota archaeon]